MPESYVKTIASLDRNEEDSSIGFKCQPVLKYDCLPVCELICAAPTPKCT